VGLIEQAGVLKADDADGGFDPDLVVPPKDQRRMDRFILFALALAGDNGRFGIRQLG
jgi:hypothetical protein